MKITFVIAELDLLLQRWSDFHNCCRSLQVRKMCRTFEAVVLEKRKGERKTREGVQKISCNFAVNARDEEKEVTDEK